MNAPTRPRSDAPTIAQIPIQCFADISYDGPPPSARKRQLVGFVFVDIPSDISAGM